MHPATASSHAPRACGSPGRVWVPLERACAKPWEGVLVSLQRPGSNVWQGVRVSLQCPGAKTWEGVRFPIHRPGAEVWEGVRVSQAERPGAFQAPHKVNVPHIISYSI
eukprot:364198-Chlamydomonas_euryale.AAC.23